MTSPITVLFITESFPPDDRVGGKRVARFCRYLPEFGVKPVVLTVQNRFFSGLDTSYRIPDGIELVRTPLVVSPLNWWRGRRKAQQMPSAGTPQGNITPTRVRRSAVRKLLDPLKPHLALLDGINHSWGWYPYALRAGATFLRKHNVAAIISSAPPWTCHLIARSLKRRFGVPWIADFRDAWTFNPWRPILPDWIRGVENRLEASFVREADSVVSVVQDITEEFRSSYGDQPVEKFVTITNGFESEPDNTPRRDGAHSRKLVLHLGSLYGDRRMDNFCRALGTLVRNARVEPGRMHVLFVGPMAPEFISTAEHEIPDLLRDGVVEFRSRVPYEEGQRLLRSADLLLLLLGDNRHVITAKFYEYISTTQQLFVIAKEGALTRMVSETGAGICADPDDVEGITAGLMHAINLPPRTGVESERIVARFHFRNLSRQLATLVQEIGRPASGACSTGLLTRDGTD